MNSQGPNPVPQHRSHVRAVPCMDEYQGRYTYTGIAGFLLITVTKTTSSDEIVKCCRNQEPVFGFSKPETDGLLWYTPNERQSHREARF